MPTLSTYFMEFHSGLHIGTNGLDIEDSAVQLPSDTLFSALLSAWLRSGGDVHSFVRPFCAGGTPPTAQAPCAAASADAPFQLTSAFPYAGGVRFFPMPVDLSRLFSAKVLLDRGKGLKRIQYLSEGILQRARQGAMLDNWLFLADEDGQSTPGLALQGGTLWMLKDEIDMLPPELRPNRHKVHGLRHRHLYTVTRVPRVTVTRTNSASTIYYVGRSSFAPGCGLWFGADWRKPDAKVHDGLTWRAAVEELLTELGDSGIGGERSAGYGAFAWQAGPPLEIDPIRPGAPAWLLSRYHPHAGELPQTLTADATSYGLVSVAGWLSSPGVSAQRRRRLTFVSEGSIICPVADPLGSICDVRPNHEDLKFPHPVYRYGLALAMGIPEQGGN